jgi:hypothetical protein
MMTVMLWFIVLWSVVSAVPNIVSLESMKDRSRHPVSFAQVDWSKSRWWACGVHGDI